MDALYDDGFGTGLALSTDEHLLFVTASCHPNSAF